MFQLFNSDQHEAIISPQLARFESKTFKQIEKNLQREILDQTSSSSGECDAAIVQVSPILSEHCSPHLEGTDSPQQSTMTNSESPSPKKDETNHDYSFSADSDHVMEFDNV